MRRLTAVMSTICLLAGCASIAPQAPSPGRALQTAEDRAAFVRVCEQQPVKPEDRATWAALLEVPVERAGTEMCARVATAIADGRINGQQIAAVMDQDIGAAIDVVLALIDPPSAPADGDRLEAASMARAISADLADQVSARVFFDDFLMLDDQYDPRLADFYADDAKVHLSMRLPDSRTSQTELLGSRFKTILRRLPPTAAQQGFGSTYENVAIAIDGKLARITATRRDLEDCHVDSGWFAVVAVQADRSYRIVEEALDITGGSCTKA